MSKSGIMRIRAALFLSAIALCVQGLAITGCNSTKKSSDEINGEWETNGSFLRESIKTQANITEPEINPDYSLSVPTFIDKIDDNWFIVDCYHNRIIYNDNLDDSLDKFKVLTSDVSFPHTMASDGRVILVDDTENNRVLIFEKKEGVYVNTQLFEDVGQRPHYTVYDENDKAFYVWSSTSGELYVFRRHEDESTVYLTEIRSIAELSGTYIRSFYIDGDDIYFVSGITPQGTSSGVIRCDKKTLEVKERYAVPDELAGMADMIYENGYYFITVSTDSAGSQDTATMIRTSDLKGLKDGNYEEIYSKYFIGGGTPYNMFKVEDRFYLTEHRLPGHSIWEYAIDENGDIQDVVPVY
ncbi:hypothetical protein [Butyrivibrio sp. NC2002]|uniref:hypothetical protein n=1 Tax=Butyrivibrio sp. NC2002 TaxID=1410610 RepID=UPI00068E223F|nr:hypothetical protein [Butyrivibrio sp. NC2002]